MDGKNLNLKILSLDLVYQLIEEISQMDLDKIAEDVRLKPSDWSKFRELRHI